MNTASRSMSQRSDLDRILEFAHQRPDQLFHVVDLPYRLCSPAAQDSLNVRLWENEQGELVGFSVIQLQFSTIDWAVDQRHKNLKDEIVHWSVKRLEAISEQRADRFGFLLDSLGENDSTALKHDFILDDWHMRHMSLRLTQALAVPSVPSGFTIRPLQNTSEVKEYVALHRAAFDTQNMMDAWRQRVLTHPLYVPDLDLVAQDEQGQLVAFCIGWMCDVNSERTAQIEPLGVLPEFHRRGLGRAILLENLRRMRARGAMNVLIDAESYNPASQHLYESVGFREVSRTLKYFRKF